MVHDDMTRTVSIIMYHYIRDCYSGPDHADLKVKGRSSEEFRFQLRFFKKHFNPITMADLLLAVKDTTYKLPPKAVLLTFDDGYLDHWQTAMPLLLEENIQGSFFPVGSVATRREILDVNKIHFILAAQPDQQRIIKDIFLHIDKSREAYDLPDEATLTAAYKGHAHRFDNPDVGFIKYALQRGLPQKLRNEICTSLFERYVTNDVHGFADSLYMNEKQLRDLHSHNMFVGGHGWMHMWLDTLSASEQQHEVEMTADFLRTLAVPAETWVMAYPYGAFNGTTRNILGARGWAAGLSTQAGIADLSVHDRFMLPRLDTNDFPIS